MGLNLPLPHPSGVTLGRSLPFSEPHLTVRSFRCTRSFIELDAACDEWGAWVGSPCPQVPFPCNHGAGGLGGLCVAAGRTRLASLVALKCQAGTACWASSSIMHLPGRPLAGNWQTTGRGSQQLLPEPTPAVMPLGRDPPRRMPRQLLPHCPGPAGIRGSQGGHRHGFWSSLY